MTKVLDDDFVFLGSPKPIQGLSVVFITPPPPGPFTQKYGGSTMSKATVDLKVYPETRKALKAVAALKNMTMAATVEHLVSREYRNILGPGRGPRLPVGPKKRVTHARKARRA